MPSSQSRCSATSAAAILSQQLITIVGSEWRVEKPKGVRFRPHSRKKQPLSLPRQRESLNLTSIS
ncbi:hypothetical protein RchiOBHm_Chr4g0423221 [Rosa chinensis]|uniref:Uncharacterized protein n=1 Tax=Rosa chinensis TaxID=74649 RepID=A0A2P6QYL2_ROSCH|nr:hypothetical protein RchiOBHm_Chr4g0423221 [Rosa chinensis]